MTAAPLTLTDFLLARIAEDEAVAREELSMPKRGGVLDWSWRDVMSRMLAECAAKRAIVEVHEGDHDCVRYVDPADNNPCETLQHLAAVYADYPDYQEEWRP